eukprot:TRINITY_DN823_c0_g1_i1.p2 TRINITY_DN823_c0_g1~~TRINITY_DN823_c0_g1_i1.p2  ORF type:complete len:145 (+),score=8.01 TRINITY_DN823_c0_g1_i1:253-687(+)
MDFRKAALFLALALSAMASAAAQASAPSTDCSTALTSLAPCVSFVLNGSTDSKPSSSCCSALSSAVANAPRCLCQALASNATAGLALNQTRAAELPSSCKIKASVSQCKASGGSPRSSAASPGTDSSATKQQRVSQLLLLFLKS